jgi:ribosomal protein L11 methylase PrmA
MLSVGKFFIVGDWNPEPTPTGLLRINMPPLGAVFGAGWHEATQAGLLALPDFITPGCSFLDVGCGSGILTVAARLLGAGKCYATDIDLDAIAAAERVFAANNVLGVELIEGTWHDWRGDKDEYDKQNFGGKNHPQRHIHLPRLEQHWAESDVYVKRHNDAVKHVPQVDVAIVSISTMHAKAMHGKLKAKKLLVVTDEFRVEDWS